MKKSLFILILCLLLCSCSPIPSSADGKSEAISIYHGDNSAQGADIEATQAIRYIAQMAPIGDGNTNGYYFLQHREDADYNIKYIDYATNTEIFLCNRPECKHDSEICTAWRAYSGNVASVIPIDDKLVLIYDKAAKEDCEKYGEQALSHIEVCELSGASPKTVFQLQANESLQGGLATDGSFLYSAVKTTQEKEDGSIESFFSLWAINLESGAVVKSEVIDFTNLSVQGAYGKQLILEGYANETEVTTERMRDWICYDTTTRQTQKLFSISAAQTSCSIDQNVIYVVDNLQATLSAYDFSGTKIADILIPAQFLAQRLFLNYASDTYLFLTATQENGVSQRLLVNKATAECFIQEQRIETTEKRSEQYLIDVVSQVGSHFLVTVELYFSTVIFPIENEAGISVQEPRYAFALVAQQDYISNQVFSTTITPIVPAV